MIAKQSCLELKHKHGQRNMLPFDKIADEIELLEQTIQDLEAALPKVMVPSVRRSLYAKIEEIKDSIQTLRENLEEESSLTV